MRKMVYQQTVVIIAPVSKVWDAMINPEITPQYMSGCALDSDWIPGSPVVWRNIVNGNEYDKGTLITFKSCTELSYTTFNPASGYIDDPANYLNTTFKLNEEDNGTRLDVSQGDFAKVENGEQRFSEATITWEMTLNTFKRLLED